MAHTVSHLAKSGLREMVTSNMSSVVESAPITISETQVLHPSQPVVQPFVSSLNDKAARAIVSSR